MEILVRKDNRIFDKRELYAPDSSFGPAYFYFAKGSSWENHRWASSGLCYFLCPFTDSIIIEVLFCADFEPLVKLVDQLVETFVVCPPTMKKMDLHSEVIEKVLKLMLCVIGCLSDSKNMPALLLVSVQWESVFNIRSRRYCFQTYL